MPTTVFYNAYEDDDEDRIQVDLIADYDLRDDTWHDSIIEQCAEHWHSEHDGWEAHWPRVFTLYATKNGPPVARMEVEREYTPEFNATPIKTPQ